MRKVLCLFLSALMLIACFQAYSFSAAANSAVYITKMTAVEPAAKTVVLAVNQSRQLYIRVLPESAKKRVAWSVADKRIAAVSSTGFVVGKKPGRTSVTVRATDASKKSITYNLIITTRKSGNNLSTKPCTIVNTKRTIYPYEQLCKDIIALKQKYPYLFNYVCLGRSYDNRGIFEIIIGNQKSKNQVFVQATMHAREYVNSMLVMEQIETLCANCYAGTYRGIYYSELLKNSCFHILPMVNPDGVSISINGAGGICNKQLRSKVVQMCQNYGKGEESYYTKWKANARGVDLNRNWDCNWEKGLTTVDYACSEAYKGAAAFSEIETRIVKKAVERVQPKAVLSYHSFGSIIYWDFIQKGALQRKCSDLFAITSRLTGYSSAENPSASTSSTATLSPCFGDWLASVKKLPTVTMETGTVACPIPNKYFPDIWKENQHILPAIAYFAMNDTAINLSALKAGKQSFYVAAQRNNASNFAYQLEYSTSANHKNAKYVALSASKGSLSVSKLKANTTYYIRIRTIKKYGTVNICGSWSQTYRVRTK